MFTLDTVLFGNQSFLQYYQKQNTQSINFLLDIDYNPKQKTFSSKTDFGNGLVKLVCFAKYDSVLMFHFKLITLL